MGKFRAIILFLVLLGCKNFETKKLSTKELVEHELKQIDWDKVDHYPSFVVCEDCAGQEEAKRCFAKVFSEEIYKDLRAKPINFIDSINEKTLLFVSITQEGKAHLDSLQASQKLKQSLPELETWLAKSVKTLPEIYPARKRGIPVSTSFTLPINFKTQ